MSLPTKAALVATLVVALTAAPAYAVGEVRESVTNVVNKAERTVESTTTQTEAIVKSTTEEATKPLNERVKSQQEQIESRKEELKQKLDQKATERKAKLEGARLAQCQNRQDNINELIGKSVTNDRERLQRIQRFEEGIKAFYEKQELTSEAYDPAVQKVDQAEAGAIAALDIIANQEFDCLMVDGVKPSDTIKSVHESKREALKAYRDNVEELLKVVREAFAQKKDEVGDAAQ